MDEASIGLVEPLVKSPPATAAVDAGLLGTAKPDATPVTVPSTDGMVTVPQKVDVAAAIAAAPPALKSAPAPEAPSPDVQQPTPATREAAPTAVPEAKKELTLEERQREHRRSMTAAFFVGDEPDRVKNRDMLIGALVKYAPELGIDQNALQSIVDPLKKDGTVVHEYEPQVQAVVAKLLEYNGLTLKSAKAAEVVAKMNEGEKRIAVSQYADLIKQAYPELTPAEAERIAASALDQGYEPNVVNTLVKGGAVVTLAFMLLVVLPGLQSMGSQS
ncbi:MAG: hypothetical protein WC775_05435 [Patescibacteria group bacterium]|jgi:hypothetical protein